MRQSPTGLFLTGATLAVVVAGASCGGGGDGKDATAGAPVHGKQGGTLTELWAGDVDSIDPGVTYSNLGTHLTGATQRTLYGFRPDDGVRTVPDLAVSAPQISARGCTVIVKIRRGIRFSPPYGQAVTTDDVRYAIERGFFKTVNTGYAGAYFGDLKGANLAVDPGTRIPGITTPDDRTIVFRLRPRPDGRCTGGVLAGALSLPLSAPVPKRWAARYDAHNASTYGQHLLSTGPYMVRNDATGASVGYEPGRSIDLVRNPNWDARTDFRPAHLDEIRIDEGNSDDSVLSRRILDARSLATGDTPPPPAILEQLANRHDSSQLALPPDGGVRWIAFNTRVKPFDNANVRRAVTAAFDRRALALARGGRFVGEVATHLIPPGVPGFAQAGGAAGPGYDFLSHPSGDLRLYAEYMKKARADGISDISPDGRWTGSQHFLMVGVSTGVDSQDAVIAKENFERLGFKMTLRQVSLATMGTKFCSTPAAAVAICPNAGWIKDFSDAQTVLDPTFNGKNILPQGNTNWAQLDDSRINQLMDEAETISDPRQRAKAWGEIDKKLTDLAPVVPWLWEKAPLIHSRNVNGVANVSTGTWDLAFSSLR